MRSILIKTLSRLAVAGVVSLALVPAAYAQCAAQLVGGALFGTIQAAINAASVNGATIMASGVCNENISINEQKHRLTLDGSGAGNKATINNLDPTASTVFVAGNGITFRNFIVNGGTAAILVTRGGSATISDNVVQGARSGINVNTTSTARITNNLVRNNTHWGIIVQESSSARIGFLSSDDTDASGNVIQNNGRAGVHVTKSGSAGIIGNNISENGAHGVEVSRGSHADLSANTIDRNAQHGVFTGENSGVNLGDAQGNTPLFDLPNETNLNNGEKGIACDTGAYVAGRRGTLNGNQGPVGMGQGCVNNLKP